MVEVLLFIVYAMLLAAIVLTLWSALRSLRQRDKSQRVVNNIPAAKIACGAALLLVVCLLLTFLLGGRSSMLINGLAYTHTFWIKAADMFINTTFVLVIVAVVGVVFGTSGINRRLK